MIDLAIVIPAYKIDFFKSTLESFANQTCKDFRIYIGDDCSPNDFQKIVNQYRNKLDIVFKKFEKNLGRQSLVAQWTRCIDMIQNERWIWLFSDDDIIGSKCIELFYEEIKNHSPKDIYHFNVNIIDSKNNIIKKTNRYPSIITSEKFYKNHACGKIDSFVVEYIFSHDIYNRVNGFQYFDLAWGSDLATWCKMGMKNGIHTIKGDFVYWRQSEKNITPNYERTIAKRKFRADVCFFEWAQSFFHYHRKITLVTKWKLFREFFTYSISLNRIDFDEILTIAVEKNIINRFFKKILIWLRPIIKIIKIIKKKIYK